MSSTDNDEINIWWKFQVYAVTFMENMKIIWREIIADDIWISNTYVLHNFELQRS